MHHLVNNPDGTQHWEGVNGTEYGILPQGIDQGESYMPDAAYLSGKKNPPMNWVSGYGKPAVDPTGSTTGYVPLPGEDTNHTSGR